MDQGVGSPATYTECFQWFIAPTTLGGQNADPTKRPHVINNSWTCPASEGCAANTLQTIVQNTEASGIFVEASAGNAGPGCSTVGDPPAIYSSAFSTGAVDSSNTLAGFSSRGPVTADGSNRMKPDVVAPGVLVRSAVRATDTSYSASFSGTSMAGPHVVGVVALLWSARPDLVRNIAATKQLLTSTANPAVGGGGTGCGGSSIVPNNHFGYGLVDALAAYNASGSSPLVTVTKAGTGSGTVTSSPSGINCGTTCSAAFTSGSTVTLTAAADTGSTFTGWSGDCSGTGTCTLTMSASRSVTATFAAQAGHMLSVTKAGAGAGTVSSSPPGITCGATCSATFSSGSSVTLTASAAAGSSFTGWSGDCSGTGTCTVTMSADHSVTATFTPTQTRTLTVAKAGRGTGTVTSSPAGISCGATCSARFRPGKLGHADGDRRLGLDFLRLERQRLLRKRHVHGDDERKPLRQGHLRQGVHRPQAQGPAARQGQERHRQRPLLGRLGHGRLLALGEEGPRHLAAPRGELASRRRRQGQPGRQQGESKDPLT